MGFHLCSIVPCLPMSRLDSHMVRFPADEAARHELVALLVRCMA